MDVFLMFTPEYEGAPWDVKVVGPTGSMTKTYGLEWNLPDQVKPFIEKAKQNPREWVNCAPPISSY